MTTAADCAIGVALFIPLSEHTSLVTPQSCTAARLKQRARDSGTLLLDLEGHQTEVVYDPTSGLAAIERFAPDSVLLDIGLPGIDGYEMARRIRAMPAGRRVRLIAVTGWGQHEDKERARVAGFDAHLTKPVGAPALSALLAGAAPAGPSKTTGENHVAI